MDDAEIATLYRRLLLCQTKHMKAIKVIRAMRAFSTTYDLEYKMRSTEKYVYHSLWYNNQLIYEVKI